MKVLVTGATGQVGRALLASVPEHVSARGCSRAELDLRDPAAIAAFIAQERPDIVINAAAYTAVDKAEDEPAVARAINATAVAVLAEALSASGGRLVHLSTDFVFDGLSSRAYQPDDPRNPLSVYGQTKAEGEDALGSNALLVRTGWVYAAGGSNFVRTMLRLMREGDTVRVVADQIGAPTFARGLAKVLWALVGAGAQGTFHHSDAGVASWYDFAVAIQEEALVLGLLANPATIVPVASADFPTRAVRPAFSLLDSSSTRAILGEAVTHWRINLRHMLREEQALG